MAKRKRILVIEDDPDMSRIFSETCVDLGYEPVVMGNYDDGITAAGLSEYALIVLDRMLPGGDGLDAISSIRQAGNGAHVLVVSALAHANNRVDGLEKGADDYLSKPFLPEELRARMKALLRRGRSQVHDNDFLVFGDLEIRVKARTVHIGQNHVPLSPKEFELLLYFASNEGEPVTRMQLLENVWNLHFDPQTNVVDVHVGRLRRKLEDNSEHKFIHTERGAGYLFALGTAGQALRYSHIFFWLAISSLSDSVY